MGESFRANSKVWREDFEVDEGGYEVVWAPDAQRLPQQQQQEEVQLHDRSSSSVGLPSFLGTGAAPIIFPFRTTSIINKSRLWVDDSTVFEDDEEGSEEEEEESIAALKSRSRRKARLVLLSILLLLILGTIGVTMGLRRRESQTNNTDASIFEEDPDGNEMDQEGSDGEGNGTGEVSITEAPTINPVPLPPPSDIIVGAYYYPWYYQDFHNREGYVRKFLEPPQYPTLGEYNDQDPLVIERHLAWSAQANVRLWVCSWWGQGKREDEAILNVILKHKQLNNLQIALYWETAGRMEFGRDEVNQETVSHDNIDDDIRYMCTEYFGHPNYLWIDDRPVLFLYLTRKLEELSALQETVRLMRQTALSYCGYDVYLVGDHAFGDAILRAGEFQLLDAITNYDNYGSIQAFPYAYQEGVDNYYDDQQDWKDMATQYNCAFIPCVSPGFNDRGVRLEVDHLPLSRKLTPDSDFGSLFRASLLRAVEQVDESTGSILMVNSFNEFHEDTQIEPVITTAEEKNILSVGPEEMVVGVKYQGYGELYLDLLRNMTANENLPS